MPHPTWIKEQANQHYKNKTTIRINSDGRTYAEAVNCDSSVAQVFPRVVIATPAMLTNTATTFVMFNESSPRKAPMKRVNSPEVEDNTVVLATLVRASAAFDKYCKATKKELRRQMCQTTNH